MLKDAETSVEWFVCSYMHRYMRALTSSMLAIARLRN